MKLPRLTTFATLRALTLGMTGPAAAQAPTPLPPEVPMTTTERAYTSPIWYTPGK